MANETREWFDLKYDLAASIIPKLEGYKKGFIEEGVCIPDWLLDEKKSSYSEKEVNELNELWVKEIDKMLLGFKQILNYNTQRNKSIGYDEVVIQAGLDSFAKNFLHFWD